MGDPPDPLQPIPPDHRDDARDRAPLSNVHDPAPLRIDLEVDGGKSMASHLAQSAGQARPNDDTVIRMRAPFGDPDTESPIRGHQQATQLVGHVLQHYMLDKMIGYGGMGVVFRATDIRLNRTVAVKVLTYNEGKNDEIIRRFRQEAQSAAQLGHENIAQVYDVGEADGWNFIAFEYINGPNIRDMVSQDGPLTVDAAIGFVLQAAEALNHANDRDIVHRDVKPSNLIVTPEGQVKLVDMGLARLRDVESRDQDLTESGMTLGTFDYISPEQAQDPRAADIRSDLYSLGCSLFFMLTGRTPFPPGTAAQKLLQHANEAPPDPREFRTDIPESLVGVLFKMLAKAPESRYQDPHQLIADLQTVADSESINVIRPRATAPSSLATPQSPITQHAPWLIPLTILLGTVFAVGGFPWIAESNVEIPDFRLPPGTTVAWTTEQPSAMNSQTNLNLGPNIESNISSVDRPQPPTVANEMATLDRTGSNGSTTNRRDPGSFSREVSPTSINEIRRIIVVDKPNSIAPPRDTFLASSLDDALQYSHFPNLREIELRSPMLELTKPLTLVDRNLAIVAGEDFSPIIRISISESVLDEDTAPDEIPLLDTDSGDASKKRTSRLSPSTEVSTPRRTAPAFRLTNSSFRLRGVVLLATDSTLSESTFNETSTLSGSTQRFSRRTAIDRVFELSGGAQVTLENCWIRADNDGSNGQPLALFDVQSPSERSPNQQRPTIQIDDCVIHGDITVARAEIGTPFELDWSNGFSASSAPLVQIGGAIRPLTVDEFATIRLDHITASLGKSLIAFESSARARDLISINVECYNCIFVGSPQQPLFEQVAYNLAVDRLEDYFHFRGRRNFYENVDVLLRRIVRDQNDTQLPSVRSMSFPEWRNYWKLDEASSRWNDVKWERPYAATAPPQTLLPDDFALSRLPGNPAHAPFGSSDRSSAGMDMDALPQLPLLTVSPQ